MKNDASKNFHIEISRIPAIEVTLFRFLCETFIEIEMHITSVNGVKIEEVQTNF